MAPLGFLKNVKDFGKKVARKVGGAINKVGKTIKDIKNKLPIDKLAKYVPYGEVINDVADIALDVAEHGGEALENIGKGKNVIKETGRAVKKVLTNDKAKEYVDKGTSYVKNKMRRPVDNSTRPPDTPYPQSVDSDSDSDTDDYDINYNNNFVETNSRGPATYKGIQDENVFTSTQKQNRRNIPAKRPSFFDNRLN